MKAEGAPATPNQSGQTLILPSFTSAPIFRTIEIVGSREGGLVDGHVPEGLIDREEVPVKEQWAEALAKDMRKEAGEHGGTGQVTPVALGLIATVPKLKIVDGFHRDAALVLNGATTIYASIAEHTWDSLFDKRIFTARDHAHVRFSRVVQWIGEVWEFSGLSDKLTVQQAVLLYRFDSSGIKLGLMPEEVEAAKEWVARKEEQWQIQSMTVLNYLKIAESVDPVLVHSTREKTGGHRLEAPTQAILKTFADDIPNNFELQNMVMQAAMAHNLRGPQVKALCQAVKDCKTPTSARRVMEQINWETWEPKYSDGTNRALRRAYDPRHKGAAVLAKAEGDIQKVIERVELSIKRGEEVTPEMRRKVLEAEQSTTVLIATLGELSSKLSTLAADKAAPAEDTVEQEGDEVQGEVKLPEQPKPESRLELFLRSLGKTDTETVVQKDIRQKHMRTLTDGLRRIGGRSLSKGEKAVHQEQIDKLDPGSVVKHNLPKLAAQYGISEIQVFIALQEAEHASRH